MSSCLPIYIKSISEKFIIEESMRYPKPNECKEQIEKFAEEESKCVTIKFIMNIFFEMSKRSAQFLVLITDNSISCTYKNKKEFFVYLKKIYCNFLYKTKNHHIPSNFIPLTIYAIKFPSNTIQIHRGM